MPFYLKYILTILSRIPWFHWVIIGVLPLALTIELSIRKKNLAFSSIALGITTLIGLFFLEMAIVVRYCGIMPHGYGCELWAGFYRLFYGGESGRREIISNIAIFVPFGFFLLESIYDTNRLTVRRKIEYVTMVAFGLSFSVECLQLVLRVGFFELTDLAFNTVGAFVGASLALMGRRVFRIDKK